jgi:hypothetical protein
MGRCFAPLELDEVERAELTSLASRRSTAQAVRAWYGRPIVLQKSFCRKRQKF